MNLIINSVHFKADKRLEDFIKEKLVKLPSVYDGVIGAEVKLKLDNNDSRENKIAEIRLMVKGNDLFAVKEAKTFEEATSKATDVLRRQLRKHKEKQRGK
ncbi:MAG: ribosome-associated translation inhibitor RaiA [Bacteroidales bacterium]|nr:ribosome-associated translation inhibitor RaiA [Bacteroidales bacterium]